MNSVLDSRVEQEEGDIVTRHVIKLAWFGARPRSGGPISFLLIAHSFFLSPLRFRNSSALFSRVFTCYSHSQNLCNEWKSSIHDNTVDILPVSG